jgi:hypothetical protein
MDIVPSSRVAIGGSPSGDRGGRQRTGQGAYVHDQLGDQAFESTQFGGGGRIVGVATREAKSQRYREEPLLDGVQLFGIYRWGVRSAVRGRTVLGLEDRSGIRHGSLLSGATHILRHTMLGT